MNEYAIQAIGFAGVSLFILSYQLRSNRALFLCQLMGCVVFFIQLPFASVAVTSIGYWTCNAPVQRERN